MAGWANDQTQRLFFRAGFEDGFHIHQQIGALKLGAFAHHQPLVFSIEADGIYQHTFMPNLTLGERARISDVSGVTSLYISEKESELTVYGHHPEQEALLQISPNPCTLLKWPKGSGSINDIGDWNNDNVIDVLSSKTCAGCTSNHIIWIGMESL